MNHFFVNGVEKHLAHTLMDERSLNALLTQAKEQYGTPSALLSSIRINGVEIGESDRAALGPVSVANFESVEVTFSHPREVAEDTLQTLLEFIPELARLSRHADSSERLTRLFDGVETFIEAVDTVKGILHAEGTAAIAPLETQLRETLEALLQAQESGDAEKKRVLLANDLPDLLYRWANEGIPTLIRLRDC